MTAKTPGIPRKTRGQHQHHVDGNLISFPMFLMLQLMNHVLDGKREVHKQLNHTLAFRVVLTQPFVNCVMSVPLKGGPLALWRLCIGARLNACVRPSSNHLRVERLICLLGLP